jgi:3-oxoacyl-[acyl-carrier-protein] synthase II
MNERRVVMTGVGPVSAIGVGREAFSAALRENRSGIAPVSTFEAGRGKVRTAAVLAGFNVGDYLESQKAYMDRSSELAYAAMSLALEDANLGPEAIQREMAGLVLGSDLGSIKTMAVFLDDLAGKGPRFVKPFLFPHTFANTAISLLAIDYGLMGLHLNFSSGMVSSAMAIIEGFSLIREGRANMVLAGGYEALNEYVLRGYEHRGVLSSDGEGKELCAPFDERRNGFVLGEGSGIVVLEELGHARARGAEIRGEVLGGGMAGDSALCRSESPASNGVGRAMRLALADAGHEVRDVGTICAAANGGVAADRNEAAAIGDLLGSRAGQVRVTSIKSRTGETLGASGVLQVIAAAEMIRGGFVASVVNLEKPLAVLSGGAVLGSAGLPASGGMLVNSVDLGGSVASLLIGAASTGEG